MLQCIPQSIQPDNTNQQLKLIYINSYMSYGSLTSALGLQYVAINLLYL